jgi:hypothetical protein
MSPSCPVDLLIVRTGSSDGKRFRGTDFAAVVEALGVTPLHRARSVTARILLLSERSVRAFIRRHLQRQGNDAASGCRLRSRIFRANVEAQEGIGASWW